VTYTKKLSRKAVKQEKRWGGREPVSRPIRGKGGSQHSFKNVCRLVLKGGKSGGELYKRVSKMGKGVIKGKSGGGRLSSIPVEKMVGWKIKGDKAGVRSRTKVGRGGGRIGFMTKKKGLLEGEGGVREGIIRE